MNRRLSPSRRSPVSVVDSHHYFSDLDLLISVGILEPEDLGAPHS